jgi:hypothetical protein
MVSLLAIHFASPPACPFLSLSSISSSSSSFGSADWFEDIRHAQLAMKHLQGRVVRRRKLDIHYSIPKAFFYFYIYLPTHTMLYISLTFWLCTPNNRALTGARATPLRTRLRMPATLGRRTRASAGSPSRRLRAAAACRRCAPHGRVRNISRPRMPASGPSPSIRPRIPWSRRQVRSRTYFA